MRRVNSWASSNWFSSAPSVSNIRRKSMLFAPRRTQRERSDTTRALLIAAATPLFAARGYHGTPADLVVRQAGVTSGALYHHFRDKRGLFRAVLQAVEQLLAQ